MHETHYGIVGECTGCGGQVVETSKVLNSGRGHLGLTCQDCGEGATIKYDVGHENPWDDPLVQEGVRDTRVVEIEWIDCPRCHGYGWVEDGLCDLRRAMNGREHPCPECHTSGVVPRIEEDA